MVNQEASIFPDLHRIVTCEERVEEALHFLASRLEQRPRRGKKPVLLHSVRVGFLLMAFGCPTDVVIAGLLHDVMEKTTANSRDIQRRFGARVAAIVRATTNDPTLRSPIERYEDSVRRCAKIGPTALVVRAADLCDNTDRVLHTPRLGRVEKLLEKVEVLLAAAREKKIDDRLVVELVKRQRRLQKLMAEQRGTAKKVAGGAAARAPRIASVRRWRRT